jgi:hypothetical protein
MGQPGVSDSGVPTIAIDFPNANRAEAVVAAPRRSAETVFAALGLTTPRPVLLVIGGAESLDPPIAAQLERLLDRRALRAMGDLAATLLGGGTASGVMAVLGRASATKGTARGARQRGAGRQGDVPR